MTFSLLRSFLPLTVIVVIAVLLRFIFLDRIPISITGDELTYIITAKSVILSGKDLTGTWSPFSILLFHYPPSQHQAELSYLLLIPWIWVFGSSLFAVRSLFALLSAITVLMIYLLGKTLFNKDIGLIATAIAAINPWFIFIGRTTYEVVPAMLFYTISIVLIFRQKEWKLLYSIPFFFLAFYSYIGTKLIFLPLVALLLWYSWVRNNKRYSKIYLIIFTACAILTILYVFTQKTQPDTSRLSEIITPSNPVITTAINEIRKDTISSPLSFFVENKLTYFILLLITKFFTIFSPVYLFITGDSFYGLWREGLFYIVDAAFLVIGCIAVFKKNATLWFVLAGLVVMSVLPHVFHEIRTDNFTPHITLFFIFAILFIAVGIYTASQKHPVIILSAISVIYILSLVHFITIYFFEYPIQGNTDFPTRLLSRYITHATKEGSSVFVYSNVSSDLFVKYLFYENVLTNHMGDAIRNAMITKQYTLNGVRFSSCNDTINPQLISGVIIYDEKCGKIKHPVSHIKIPQLSDGGEVYGIYNDTVCHTVSLNRFPKNISFADLPVERLSNTQFCQHFITY